MTARLGDTARLGLLVAAAGIVGLAIVIVFEQPVRPAVHAGVSAAPSSEVVQDTTDRRRTIDADVQLTAGHLREASAAAAGDRSRGDRHHASGDPEGDGSAGDLIAAAEA